jgi:hypothetical protein
MVSVIEVLANGATACATVAPSHASPFAWLPASRSPRAIART